MSTPTQECKECGTPLTASRRPKTFCSTKCRQASNNRRMERGGQLYDLFMSMRFEREKATDLGLWAIMCRMASAMRDEDNRERDGRKSWQPVSAALERLPVVMTARDVYMKREKFGLSNGRTVSQ